ncbi:MAG: hypothetical protein AAGD25_17095 [Cyanobacteria bacterium P01_F01_bin.150]
MTQVYALGADLPDDTELLDSTPVLIAEPVHWTGEIAVTLLA